MENKRIQHKVVKKWNKDEKIQDGRAQLNHIDN